jgi:hypothetical protein
MANAIKHLQVMDQISVSLHLVMKYESAIDRVQAKTDLLIDEYMILARRVIKLQQESAGSKEEISELEARCAAQNKRLDEYASSDRRCKFYLDCDCSNCTSLKT